MLVEDMGSLPVRRLTTRSAEQVTADGGEVQGGADEDEAVPDGVRERHDAVALEEDDADHVDEAAGRQLRQTRHVLLHVHIPGHVAQQRRHTHQSSASSSSSLTFQFHA